MQTLISAGALSTIREVWWDIRPHPDFGTIELRMCDGLPTLREVTALAALSQCLVTWLDQRAEAGEVLQPPSDWVLRQNKWRAARYGIEADLIVDQEGSTRPLPEAVTELVTALRPVRRAAGLRPGAGGRDRDPRGGPQLRAPAPAHGRRRRPAGRRGPARRRPGGRPVSPSPVSDVLDRFLAAHGEELVAFRRRLHAHPELSWQEHETTAAVRARFDVAGIEAQPLSTETGLQVDIGPGGDGPTILLRADIDALPLQDEKEVPYRSTVPGVCHACGHDVHTTILLGAGLALRDALGERPGRVRLLFQPAEEAMPGGAETLHHTPVLDDVDVAFALHCDPGVDVGHVGLRSGLITSAADRVDHPPDRARRPHRPAAPDRRPDPHRRAPHHRPARGPGEAHRQPRRRDHGLRPGPRRPRPQRDPHPRRAEGHAPGPGPGELGRRAGDRRAAGRGHRDPLRRRLRAGLPAGLTAGRQRSAGGRRAPGRHRHRARARPPACPPSRASATRTSRGCSSGCPAPTPASGSARRARPAGPTSTPVASTSTRTPSPPGSACSSTPRSRP